MNKQNIPKLRFPEFKGEWEKKKLGEVAEKINSGKTPLGGESVYTEKGILFIRSQNIIDDKLSYENSTFISEEINSTMKNSVVKPKDILLNITGASLGRSCVVPEDFIIGNVNQHVCIIRFDNSNEPYFIQPILSSEKGQNIFTSLQTGSGREGLNFQSIRSIELSFPSLSEQTRIASFFTVIDKKLSQLKQKKNLLEEYKKGVMQKLFSQELRFKIKNEDGELVEPPKWEKKRLGEVAEIKKGEQLNKEELKEFGSYPCLNGGINHSGFTEKYNSDENTITVSEGGNSCGYVNLMTSKFWLGGHCYKILVNQKINQNYFYQLLKFNEQKIMNLRVGSGLPNIQQKDIRNFEFIFTNSKDEQTRIANFLTAIDKKIMHCEKQIEQTEIWKKGLLQKMFV